MNSLCKKFVLSGNLTERMVIDSSILNRAGQILICSGARLSDTYIKAIRRMKIGGVYVLDDNDLLNKENSKIVKAIDDNTVNDRSKVSIAESVKNRISTGIQYLYNNTDSKDFSETTKNITDILMDAIDENDAVVVDIGELRVCDDYTFKHSVDVATMAMIVAKTCGFSKLDIYEIGMAGLLHDIGKSKIPNEILNKPGKLTFEEFDLMKKHPTFGFEILKGRKDIAERVKQGVLQHHEKENGSGYPVGIKGNLINIFSKIIAVVDIYDALVTERPYKKAFSPRDAVEMIMSMTGELDASIMRSFLRSIILYPVGSDVMLSNGVRARVVKNNEAFVLRPRVIGLENGVLYDLADKKWLNLVIV